MNQDFKNILTGAFVSVILVFCFALLGWGLGKLGGMILAPDIERIAAQPVWYCIEGKVYEKISDTYVTVVPARTCLPVIKD